MILDEIPKPPIAAKNLCGLPVDLLITLDILFAHFINDPFAKMTEYVLEERWIDGLGFDCLRGAFRGAQVTLIFHPNDQMYLVDIVPNVRELINVSSELRTYAN